MSRDAILQELTGIFREVIGNDDIKLAAEMTAEDVEGWDSAAHIMIIVAAEMRMGVKFQAGEVENLMNVGDLVSLIETKKA
jgi:acyl carrier protein